MPRLPAEWESQSAVMLTWPHADTDWANQLDILLHLYAALAARIAQFEQVLLVCRDETHQAEVERLLAGAGAPRERVLLVRAESNDTWARDHGPITVIDDYGRPRLTDFRFNGWGGKFEAGLDNAITAALHRSGVFGSAGLQSSSLVLEGGAIETDGAGTLLVVERTLRNANRNPGLSRAEIEAEITRLLGIRRFLWLTHGELSGDDTDGHIDTLARFCAPDTLCYVRCTDPADPDHAGLAAMAEELRAFRTGAGEPYRLVPLPHPAPVHDQDGRRLAASYANFLIINGAVLVPVYCNPADQTAVECLAGLFPDREILPVDCRPLIRQGGSLHCITMQIPAPVSLGGR